jgi:hypothetical protein
MVSISHVVEDLIKHRPYLSESLAAGIINVSSLARQLQADVEKALGRGVNTGAIVMALNRLAPYLQMQEQAVPLPPNPTRILGPFHETQNTIE